MKDPYKILGIPFGSNKDVAQKAYKKLIKQWHPDMHPPDKKEEVTQKFKQVIEAYNCIKDSKEDHSKRHAKDFSMDDLFSNFFGNASYTENLKKVGDDIKIVCEISLEEAMNGSKRKIKYNVRKICTKCNGLGGTLKTCEYCNGTGTKTIVGSFTTMRVSCSSCNSTGKRIADICLNCEDGFLGELEETIDFEIPKGVEPDSSFCYRGKGHLSKDGLRGNLYITVVYKKHNVFDYINGDLLYSTTLNYSDFVLGTNIDVPLLNKDLVSLKIPAGSKPGQRLRLKEMGLPKFSNRTGSIYSCGDQLVEIRLSIPKDISEEHKNLILKLSEFEKNMGAKNG